jgi:hypothetical protein
MGAQWAVVTHNVAAMRAGPEGGSEQISQAIMGDAVHVLELQSDFARVQAQDEYEGWILQSHVRLCDETDLFINQPTQNQPTQDRLHRIVAPFADFTSDQGELITRLVFATRIRVVIETAATGSGVKCRIASGATGFVPALAVSPLGCAPQPLLNAPQPPILGGPACDSASARTPQPPILGGPACDSVSARDAPQPSTHKWAPGLGTSTCDRLPRDLCAIARQFLGTPYLWGGTTPFGFDCSGFVQRVYSTCGIQLPRDAYLQVRCALGAALPEGALLAAGDLVFFCGARDPRHRGITHVGMMLDDARMIHASGNCGVTIQPLRDPGILSAYSYRGAWRCRQRMITACRGLAE